VNGILWGIAPQTRSVPAGGYTVSFGDFPGYLTPPPQTVTLAAGETKAVTGVYTEIESESPPIYIPSITPEENATITVENVMITEMTISVKENVENVRITVQQLTDKPAEIAIGAPGVVYRYLNIVAENITDADIDVVLINFKVEKSWIILNYIDIATIALNRYDPLTGEWTSLPTTYLSEDDTYAYFSAVSPGLSVFGISGQALQPDFTVSVSPTSGSEVQGGSTTTTVSVLSIYGFTDTVSLSASGLPSGATASFSPASGTPSFTSTLTISTASTTPAGTYTITITGTGGGVTHSTTYTLTVKATPVIMWSNPADITYGTALSGTQLNASANVAGSLVYSPAAGTVLSAGSNTLSVTFTPTDTTDYTMATDSVTITVLQATPVITWATPASITYGTALSGTQLNASANVAGSLVYSPAAGTVLSAGSNTLSVTFTPTDTENYNTATDNVTLTVVAAPDFTMSVAPASGSVVQGGSVTTTVSLSPTGGFADTVSLSVSGLPSGATASFSPASGTPSFTSALTISTASTTPAGTYTITITGTGGGITHSITYTLTVTAPPAPFIVPLALGIVIFVLAIGIVMWLWMTRWRA